MKAMSWKKTVICLSSTMLLGAFASHAANPVFAPSKYTYTASDLSVHFKNSVGKRSSLHFQQCTALEVPANTTNTNSITSGTAEADSFGVAYVQVLDLCNASAQSANSGNLLLSVSLSANYNFLQNAIAIQSTGEELGLFLAGGGARPYTLTDTVITDVTGGAVSIPNGNHTAGESFDISAPLTVTTDAGTSETDTFKGKLVLGEVHPLRDDWGNVVGTRFVAIHICGELTASDGGKYEIEQNIGQTDIQGIRPHQITYNFTFTEF